MSAFNSDGKEVAYDAVRIKLQEIVDQEDKQKPYSDDELVRQLGSEGLKVARRTVTKYRKSMGIPSSRQRRPTRHTAHRMSATRSPQTLGSCKPAKP